MKVLMVCLGNICRSPLAEGILKESIVNIGKNWLVDSAGTSGFHAGQLPDRRSVQISKKYGIDISDQRSRKVTKEDYQNFDLILAMDKQNLHDLQDFFKIKAFNKEKIRLISSFSNSFHLEDIPDPYYDDNGFEKVYNMLEESIEGLVKFYRNTD